ncbi:MAG: SMI1/KNR4 family protein [Gemmataceae bacterium]
MDSIKIAYDKFCEARFPLPSEQQVKSLERRLGIPLPPDFRKFLLEYNGGIFNEPEIVPPEGQNCPHDRLTYIEGLGGPKEFDDFGSPASLSLFEDNDPPQLAPIGHTMMGNLIWLVVDPDGDDRGAIGLKKAFADEHFFLADGIDGFFALLRDPTNRR